MLQGLHLPQQRNFAASVGLHSWGLLLRCQGHKRQLATWARHPVAAILALAGCEPGFSQNATQAARVVVHQTVLEARDCFQWAPLCIATHGHVSVKSVLLRRMVISLHLRQQVPFWLPVVLGTKDHGCYGRCAPHCG